MMQQEGSVGGGSKLNTSEKENQRQKKIISTESLMTGIIFNVSSCLLISKPTKVHKAITQRVASKRQRRKEKRWDRQRKREASDMTDEERD